MSYSETLSGVVIDANLAIMAVLPVRNMVNQLERFVSWNQEQVKIHAPEIMLPEAVSAIRQSIYHGLISEEDGRIAVEDLFLLGIEVSTTDIDLCQATLTWASRLGQSKAYDSFYLALAEQMKVELWTADEKLANRAYQLGASWVRWAGSN